MMAASQARPGAGDPARRPRSRPRDELWAISKFQLRATHGHCAGDAANALVGAGLTTAPRASRPDGRRGCAVGDGNPSGEAAIGFLTAGLGRTAPGASSLGCTLGCTLGYTLGVYLASTCGICSALHVRQKCLPFLTLYVYCYFALCPHTRYFTDLLTK